MAKGTGKSGRQVAEENVQKLVATLERYSESPLPRMGVELNKSALARECGFRREVFRDNPRCGDLLEEAERRDRARYLNALGRAEIVREEKGKIEKERLELERQILELAADKARIERELERYKRRDALMAETGKLC